MLVINSFMPKINKYLYYFEHYLKIKVCFSIYYLLNLFVIKVYLDIK